MSDKKPSEKFINAIKVWVNLDNQIRKLKEETKELNDEKKQHETIILDELDKMDEKVIAISDGKLRKNVSKTQAAFKKENIQQTIFEFTKDEQKTYDIIEKVMASRQIIEKVNLKRVKNKDSVIKKSDKEI